MKLILALFISFNVYAQTGNLQGKITSDGEPIPGVNILVMGTSIGGITDQSGYFRIERIPSGEQEIRFSAVGYTTRFLNVEISPNRTLERNIELKIQIIDIDEVEVVDNESQKQSDTRTSLIDLKPGEARTLPGAVTDVMRTLQALPGVLAPNDFSSQLIIRGSTPDQNLIIMDDVEIFNPYRLYGVVSMFNPEAVSDINLITGGFPAQYGDRLSAVLDVTNRQGTRTDNISGNINASIVAANIVLEGKNPFNIPGSWLINSRRTYYDLIIEPFVKNAGLVEENVSFPNFFDVQTKLAFGPFNGHKFLINGILSRDAVRVISGKERTTPDSVSVVDDSDNDLASFAWHYTPDKNTLNKFIVSWYSNGGDSNFDSKFLDPSLDRNDFEDVAPDTLSPYLLGFKFDAFYGLEKYSVENKFTRLWGGGNELDLGAGVDFVTTEVDFNFELDPTLEAFLNSNANFRATLDDIKDINKYNRYKAYINNRFSFNDRLFIQPGIRYDYYGFLKKGYISPRFSVSYALNNLTTLRAVWGLYYQSPGYEKMRDRNILFDLNSPYMNDLEAERSIHYVLSLERWLNAEWRVKVEGYYKKFDDLIERLYLPGSEYYTELIPGRDPRDAGSWTRPVTNFGDSLTQIPVNVSEGEAFGLEFLLEKKNITKDNKLDGWISYAYAKAETIDQGIIMPFRFDQTHTFNLVLNYKFNSWFDMSARFQFGSGFPSTDAVGIRPRIILEDNDGDLIPETPVIATRSTSENKNEVVFDVDFGGLDNRQQGRKPEYHRLDLRFNFLADWFNLDWVLYLDIINIYNRQNVIGYDYSVTDDLQLEREATNMLPIVPTIGFNVRF